MKIIYGARGSGKTTELIKLSAERGGYIVCPSKSSCNYIFELAKELGLSIPFPISYYEVILGDYYGGGIKEFYIDDVDLFIKTICKGVRVEAITFTPFGSLKKLELSKEIKDQYKEQLSRRMPEEYLGSFEGLYDEEGSKLG